MVSLMRIIILSKKLNVIPTKNMLWKITCKKTQINSNKNKNYQIIILTKEEKQGNLYEP